jgi:hypothetical protein
MVPNVCDLNYYSHASTFLGSCSKFSDITLLSQMPGGHNSLRRMPKAERDLYSKATSFLLKMNSRITSPFQSLLPRSVWLTNKEGLSTTMNTFDQNLNTSVNYLKENIQFSKNLFYITTSKIHVPVFCVSSHPHHPLIY